MARRPRVKSKAAQDRCGDWSAVVVDGTQYCEWCGKDMGPATGPEGCALVLAPVGVTVVALAVTLLRRRR